MGRHNRHEKRKFHKSHKDSNKKHALTAAASNNDDNSNPIRISDISVINESANAATDKPKSGKQHRSNLNTTTINNQQSKNLSAESAWNFPVDYNDHFETPLQAYRDILPLLQCLCTNSHSESSNLSIYDPYYCKGSMKTYLANLGFTSVINENRDFYADISANRIPGMEHS